MDAERITELSNQLNAGLADQIDTYVEDLVEIAYVTQEAQKEGDAETLAQMAAAIQFRWLTIPTGHMVTLIMKLAEHFVHERRIQIALADRLQDVVARMKLVVADTTDAPDMSKLMEILDIAVELERMVTGDASTPDQ